MKKKKSLKTKIFCDTADIKVIKRLNRNPIVAGFTTNPSLMRLSGAKSYKSYSKRLLKICNKKPISLEVIADEFEEIEKQANEIKSWGNNVYVKIPITNSKGNFSGKIIKRLSDKGLKLNITAVYTVSQVKKIIKCLNKNSYTIISIFSGRMADVGKDPIPIIKESVRITKKIKKIQILWASTREAYNFTQANDCQCEIITIPPKIIEKITKFGKSFKALTIDTVKTFYKDAVDANFKIKTNR